MKRIIEYSVTFFLILLYILFALNPTTESRASVYNPPIEIEKSVVKIDVSKDFSVSLQGEIVVKILTEKGVHENGQVEIPYSESLESFEILDAHTIKKDGSIVPVLPERIFTKESPATIKAPVFADRKLKVIVFSEIEVGNKIFYRFKRIRKKPFLPDTFLYSIAISPHIKNQSDIQISSPKDINIFIDKRGFREINNIKKSENNNLHFISESKKAFPPETDELSSIDLGNYLFLSSVSNYTMLSEKLECLWKEKAKISPSIEKLAKEITKDEEDKEKQVHLLYNWVSRNIRYVAVHLGVGAIIPHQASEVISNKYGDCKDHAVLLEALLRAKGIESTPALINNSLVFYLPRVATTDVFNHVITYVPSLNLFLDSTTGYAPFGVLPDGDIDKSVLLGYTGKIMRTHIPDVNLRVSTQNLRVLPNGSIEGISQESFTGPCDVGKRFAITMMSERTDEELIRKYLAKNNLTGWGKIDRGDPKVLDKETSIKTDFHLDANKHLSDAGIFIIPTVFSSTFGENIKKHTNGSKRLFDFFCNSAQFKDDYEIEFPKNYNISKIPNGVNVTFGPFQYKSSYELDGVFLRVKRQYVSKPSNLVCKPDVYESLKKIASIVDNDLTAPVKYTIADK